MGEKLNQRPIRNKPEWMTKASPKGKMLTSAAPQAKPNSCIITHELHYSPKTSQLASAILTHIQTTTNIWSHIQRISPGIAPKFHLHFQMEATEWPGSQKRMDTEWFTPKWYKAYKIWLHRQKFREGVKILHPFPDRGLWTDWPSCLKRTGPEWLTSCKGSSPNGVERVPSLQKLGWLTFQATLNVDCSSGHFFAPNSLVPWGSRYLSRTAPPSSLEQMSSSSLWGLREGAFWGWSWPTMGRDSWLPCQNCNWKQVHVPDVQWGQTIRKCQSLEQSKVYCRAMQGDGWLMHPKLQNPWRISGKYF